MPWHVTENHSECPSSRPYAVVKDDDGAVEGCHATREQANEQMRALYASEDGEEAVVAAASGSSDLPLSDRGRAWDSSRARQSMSEDQYPDGHFWRDPDGNPETLAAYKLPFAEVINGRLTAVWRGVTAAAGRLDQTDMPSADRAGVRSRIEGYYAKARRDFDDPSIRAPWESSQASVALSAAVMQQAARGMLATRVAETTVGAAVDFTESSMVALYPTLEQAQAMAMENGQPAETIHVTLAHLPEGVSDVEGLSEALATIAFESPKLEGTVGGVGFFAKGEDGVPIIVLPDAYGINDIQEEVCEALDASGVPRSTTHSWNPHMTLSYEQEAVVPDADLIGMPLTFTAISLVVGEDRYDYEFAGMAEDDEIEDEEDDDEEEPEMGAATTTAGTFTVSDVSSNSVTSSATTLAVPLALEVVPEEEIEDTEIEDDEDEGMVGWEGILTVEGYATNDGRYLMPGDISHRDLPLPFMVQTKTAEGHDGAEIGGKITEVWRVNNEELGPDAVEVWARGEFDNSEMGREARRLVETETLRGVSVDMDISEVALLDAESLEEIDAQEMDLEDMLFGNFVQGIKGKIMGVTLVPFPAIEHASISVIPLGDRKALVASAFGLSIRHYEVLTASAKGLAPLQPPRDWFFQAEADRPTPLTVTSDGRVYGHLAIWGSCHVGHTGVCKQPYASDSNYAYFHLGKIETAEGEMVAIGKITVDAPHASTSVTLSPERVRAHYDQTGTVAAFVRAHDGMYGIWLSGAVRSDLPAEKVRDLRANPPSGDWRGRELQAVLSVPVPGFPIPHTEMVLVASGSEEEEEVVRIATGFVEPPLGEKATRRRLRALTKRAKALS